MDNSKTNVALVGCGYWGKNLARVLAELGVLSCICDKEAPRLQSMELPGERPRMTDCLDSVLMDSSISAVVIATPAATHFDVVQQCIQAGKHVLVEKPLALNVDEGRELIELAESKSLTLMVGHLLLYHPAVVKLRELVDAGELGKIQYCYSNRLNMGKIRTEENTLWSFAPHDISVLNNILGEVPQTVQARGDNFVSPDVADVSMSMLQYPSGVSAHIFVSWLHPIKEQRLVVVGSKQMAVFDDGKEDKLVLYPHRVEWNHRAPQAVKGQACPVNLDWCEPLQAECRHFMNCIESGSKPLSNGFEALGVLQVLDACQESLEHGGELCKVTRSDSSSVADQPFYAHETACIDLPHAIGEGTKIWHYSHVSKGSQIGRNCSLGQNVYVAPTAVIGNNVKIQNNVSLYDGVTLEDDVFCGPSAVLTNVINPRSEIPRKNEYKATLVRQGATLGANCTIVCGNTIGKRAFVAAGSTVTKDVPAYALVAGTPARQLGWMCRCAEGRLAFNDEMHAECVHCTRQYELRDGHVEQLPNVIPLDVAAVGEPRTRRAAA